MFVITFIVRIQLTGHFPWMLSFKPYRTLWGKNYCYFTDWEAKAQRSVGDSFKMAQPVRVAAKHKYRQRPKSLYLLAFFVLNVHMQNLPHFAVPFQAFQRCCLHSRDTEQPIISEVFVVTHCPYGQPLMTWSFPERSVGRISYTVCNLFSVASFPPSCLQGPPGHDCHWFGGRCLLWAPHGVGGLFPGEGGFFIVLNLEQFWMEHLWAFRSGIWADCVLIPLW